MSSTKKDSISPEHYKMFQHLSAIFSETAMQNFMLELITQNVSNVLEMTRSVLQNDSFYKRINSPHKLFVWRCDQFMKNLKSDKPCFDVTKFEDKRNILNCKFLMDLDNIADLMLEIIYSRQDGQESLKDCQKLNNLHTDLTLELLENRELCKNLKEKFEKFGENVEQEQQLLEIMDNCMDEILVIDPVIQRYKLNSHDVHCVEIRDKISKQQEDIENKIDDCKKLLISNVFAHKQTALHNEMTIETLRNKITYWTHMNDVTWDHIENENANLKLRNKVLEENFNSCKQRLIFIREETARMAAEEMEKLKKEAEQEALANLKAKVKKPKKKKADKKTKKK